MSLCTMVLMFKSQHCWTTLSPSLSPFSLNCRTVSVSPLSNIHCSFHSPRSWLAAWARFYEGTFWLGQFYHSLVAKLTIFRLSLAQKSQLQQLSWVCNVENELVLVLCRGSGGFLSNSLKLWFFIQHMLAQLIRYPWQTQLPSRNWSRVRERERERERRGERRKKKNRERTKERESKRKRQI